MRLFNFWKPYPKYKPKKSGWYVCTVRFNRWLDGSYQSYVINLWYDDQTDTWKNNIRLDVFKTYRVMGGAHGNERIYADAPCYRKDVIAFKELPRIYKPKNKV